jgi:hypothetical protein
MDSLNWQGWVLVIWIALGIVVSVASHAVAAQKDGKAGAHFIVGLLTVALHVGLMALVFNV